MRLHFFIGFHIFGQWELCLFENSLTPLGLVIQKKKLTQNSRTTIFI